MKRSRLVCLAVALGCNPSPSARDDLDPTTAEKLRAHSADSGAAPGVARLAPKPAGSTSADSTSSSTSGHSLPVTTVAPEASSFGVPLAFSKSWWQGAPYPSLQRLCAAFQELQANALHERSAASAQHCDVERTLHPTGRAPLGVRAVHVGRVVLGSPDTPRNVRVLWLENDAGWTPSNLVLDRDAREEAGDHRGSTLYLVRVEDSRWSEGALELDLLRRISVAQPPESQNIVGLTRQTCTLAPRFSCHEVLIAYGDPDPLGHRVAATMDSSRFRPKLWQWQRTAQLGADGRLVLGECKNPQQEVASCDAPHASRLP